MAEQREATIGNLNTYDSIAGHQSAAKSLAELLERLIRIPVVALRYVQPSLPTAIWGIGRFQFARRMIGQVSLVEPSRFIA